MSQTTIFKDCKYTVWYYNLIAIARTQARTKIKSGLRKSGRKSGVYWENHHIIPKSLGGLNASSNLVLLSAKEHFIAHLLLTKMCSDKANTIKMLHAFNMFRFGRGDKPSYTSKMYDLLKPQIAIAIRTSLFGKNNLGSSLAQRGVPKTEEHRAAISKGLIGNTNYQCRYLVMGIDGLEYVVDNRADFCKQHGLQKSGFSTAANNGRLYKGYKITLLPRW